MLFILLISFVLIGLVYVVASASVTTDQEDYDPGATVLISGSGFQANTNMVVSITRPDSVVESCSQSNCNARFLDGPLTSSSSGGFSNYRYLLNGVTGEYTLSVSDGATSASSTFTDAVIYLNLTYPEASGIVLSGTKNISIDIQGAGTVYFFYSDNGCHGTTRPSSTAGDSNWHLIGSRTYSSNGIKNYPWDTTTVSNGTNYCVLVWDGQTGIAEDSDRSNNVFEIANGPAAVCGNGIVEGSEQCESGACCDLVTCQFKSSSVVCRASAGECDMTEKCTGSSASCPSDSFNSSSTVCRASQGVCDLADTCTGSSASCSADSKSN